MTNPLLDVALAAIRGGLSVHPPLEDGTKAPFPAYRKNGKPTWLHASGRPANEATAREWYGPRAGVGLRCGAEGGGLECFEFDCPETYERYKTTAAACGLGDLVARIEAGYREETPGGGVHWLYITAEIRGNTKLAKAPAPTETAPHGARTLIETKGENGFVIIAPSGGGVHPTGRPYVLTSGGLGSIATLDGPERDALWDLARSFDSMPRATAEPRPKGRPPTGELRPGDAYNREMTWADILGPAKWEAVYTRGETTYWRRPGKGLGISATTNHGGSGLLYVFTSSTAFDSERSYSKFGAYAVLNHGGDYAAAAKCLKDMGYGQSARAAGGQKQYRATGTDGRATGVGDPGPNPHGFKVRGGGDEGDQGAADEGPDRPKIMISTDEFEVNNAAVAALALDPEVFCRGGYLVTIHRDAASSKLITRPPETPRISALQKASIRERLTKNADWVKWKWDVEAEKWKEVATHPPDWAPPAIEARGRWDGVRPLEGITETPVLLPDGSILDTPGYDDRTGLLYEPNCDFPPIPSRITQADARKAAEILMDLVGDFPFARIGHDQGETDDGGVGHRAAYLSGLLTPLARYAIDGPCPLFLADANVAGAGKSKLCDVVAIIATGRKAARTTYPETDEEMRKQILAIAIEGDRLVLIDNVATGAAIGGAALDAALTATTIKGRILGRTEMSREVPIYTVWYATGNNLGLKGDALRRVVPYRLESDKERPEERKDFRIKGDLLKHVREHRGRLFVAAMTILRGYVLAGSPEANLLPMDYPEWCRVVRQAIHWAIGIDPCVTRKELVADDPETNALKGLLAGWAELPRGTTGITTREAFQILTAPEHKEKYSTLRDVLMEWSRDGEIPSPKSIGMRLKKIKGRVLEGKSLKSTVSNNTQSWRVVEVTKEGTKGTKGTNSSHAGESSSSQFGCGQERNRN